MMMTSIPYFILLKPNTLKIIEKIWSFREQTKIPVCFTLDAGANVHVLFPEEDGDFVMTFIRQELAVFCDNEQYIEDKLGFGSERIK
jgi:diphosphomevalonate decarboxylase